MEEELDIDLNNGSNNLSSKEELDLIAGTGKRYDDADKFFDDLARFNGVPTIKTLVSNTHYGINQMGTPTAAPFSTDQYGLVFFTRPRFNLSQDNVKQDRIMGTLLNSDKNSIPSIIRAYLDPVGHRKRNEGSPLVDKLNPFISMLTNYCETLSGWPDPFMEVRTSKAGMFREEHISADGFANNYGRFDLTGSFTNPVGKPITHLLKYWIRYMGLIKEGVMNPYPEAIFENEMDYNTRAYRIILDPTRKHFTGISACGAALPTNTNLGSMYDYEVEKPISETVNSTSLTLSCVGSMYDDPILYNEFNDLVVMFNPNMADAKRAQVYVKLTPGNRLYFNFSAYPRLNAHTAELEWWVAKEEYSRILNKGKLYGYNGKSNG